MNFDKKHFVFFNGGYSFDDNLLESYAIKTLREGGKVLFIDNAREVETASLKYSEISSKSPHKQMFVEEGLKNIENSIREGYSFIYMNLRKNDFFEIDSTLESLSKSDIENLTILIHTEDSVSNKSNFSKYSKTLLYKHIFCGIRSGNKVFCQLCRENENFIFYSSKKLINFS